MKHKNAFYAQSGGVTSVINASAAGIIETARQHQDQIPKVLTSGKCPEKPLFINGRFLKRHYKTSGLKAESGSLNKGE